MFVYPEVLTIFAIIAFCETRKEMAVLSRR